MLPELRPEAQDLIARVKDFIEQEAKDTCLIEDVTNKSKKLTISHLFLSRSKSIVLRLLCSQ